MTDALLIKCKTVLVSKDGAVTDADIADIKELFGQAKRLVTRETLQKSIEQGDFFIFILRDTTQPREGNFKIIGIAGLKVFNDLFGDRRGVVRNIIIAESHKDHALIHRMQEQIILEAQKLKVVICEYDIPIPTKYSATMRHYEFIRIPLLPKSD